MTAIILAGGKSSRFGSDKAFIEIDGIPLIKRQLKLLKKVFKKIIIVTNQPQKYRFRNVKIAQDILKNLGPLAGIYSGLMASSSFYNFVIACDMPFINKPLIRYIIDCKDNYDIIIPKLKQKFHPLFGVYSKNCITVIKNMLEHNRLKVSNIFPRLKTRFILTDELERLDKELISLVNINTRDDLRMVKREGWIPICQNQHSQI